jgi:endonuclease/exonuclease/phosphatase family metal-dependent hydrolase
MRILTLNILARQADWQSRRRVLIEGLRELSPDVVTLQETVKSEDYDQVADLLGRDYYVFHQAGRAADGCGASIASRWPLDVVREANLDVADRVEQAAWLGSVAIVEIAMPEPMGAVLVVHHKPTWQSGMELERERLAVASARMIEELLAGGDRHVVLAGDFDATPDCASVRFWTGRQSLQGISVYYQDAWAALHPDDPGHTFTPRNPLRTASWRPRPGRRIDYILVRCGSHGATLDIVACELAFAEPRDGVWASDHFGVFADLIPASSS